MAFLNAGHAYLQVTPSFDGIRNAFEREVAKLGQEIDKTLGKSLPQAVENSAKATEKAAAEAGKKAGKKFVGEFAEQAKRRLGEARKAIGKVKIDGDTDELTADIEQLGKQMDKLAKKKIGKNIDADEFVGRVGEMAAALRQLEVAADGTDKVVNVRVAMASLEALTDLAEKAQPAGAEAGRRFGGAFAEQAVKAAESAAKKLPEFEIDADLSDVEEEIRQVREELLDLSRMKIGFNISTEEFLRRLQEAQRRLEAFKDDAERDDIEIPVEFDLDQAGDDLRRFLGRVMPEVADEAEEAGEETGRRFASGLSEMLHRDTSRLLDSLPEFQLDANTTPAQAEIIRLREMITRLNADIELGLDDGVALSRMRVIVGILQELDRFEADPTVSANAGVALARLREVLALIERIDGANPDVRVGVDDGASRSLRQIADEAGITMHRLGFLVSTIASIGPAIVPVAAVGTVALSGLGTAALAAVSGIGVLFVALNGVGDALKALNQFQLDADKSAKSLAQSQNAIASAQDGVASAERGLAQARISAADQEREAQQRIADAVRDVARARREAQEAVRDATRAAVDADQDYKQSLVETRDARLALNEAYRQARRDLAELNAEVRRNQLDQRQAALDLKAAKQELDELLANPRASREELEQARITYERRVLQVEDLRRRSQELAAQQAKANKEGVKGSKVVQDAQKRIAAADRAAEQAQQRLRDAQAAVVQARLDGAQRIADAQRAEADSRRDADRQQVQSQFQLAAAQQSLAAAQRNLAQAHRNMATAGGDALDTLRDKMSKLSPAGQAFVYFLDSLEGKWRKIQRAAQEGLFPGLQRGLEALTSDGRIDAFADFLFRVADAMGRLFERAVKALDDPTWKRFGTFISQNTVPALEGMFEFGEKVARGLAALLMALSPFNKDLGKGIIGLADSFARWAESLAQNPQFQQFLGYVRDNIPVVVGFIKELATFFFRLVVAAAPIGTFVLKAFTLLLELLNKIPIGDLRIIVGVLGGVAAAFVAVAAATALAGASVSALVIGIIAGSIVYWRLLYSNVKPIRVLFDAIGAAAVWLWKNALVPAFQGIGQVAKWLYDNVVVKVFQGFRNRMEVTGVVVSWLWHNALEPAFRGIGAAVLWLWDNAIKPALGFIGGIFKWVWDNAIKPILDLWATDTETLRAQQSGVFNTLGNIFRAIGAVAMWLWTNAIKPAFDGIAAVAMWLWQNIIVPVFNGISAAIGVAWAILQVIFNAIKAAVGVLGAVFSWLYTNIIQPVWQRIVIAARVGWAILSVIFGLIKIAFKIVGFFIMWVWNNLIKPAWNRIAEGARLLWEIYLKPKWEAIKAGFRVVGEFFGKIWNDVIKPAWNRLVSGIKGFWEDHIKPVFDILGNIWEKKIKPAWQRGVDAVGKIWEGLKEKAKTPIKFIVNDVLNNGLLKGYNFLAKTFQVKPDDVRIDLPKGFATGGAIHGPGTETSDSVLIRASRGEHMWTAREVRAAGGHDAVHALRNAVLRGMLPGFARGGAIGRGFRAITGGDRPSNAVGGFGDWLKDTAKAIGKRATDVFTGVQSFLADPMKSLKDLATGLISKIPGIDSTAVKQILGVPKHAIAGLLDKAKNLFSAATPEGVPPGGLGVASAGGLGGSAGMMRILRAVFPGLPLNSGYRPGAITATGNPSMHGVNRAVDVPPRMDVFNWIRAHYPNSKELIFSPAGNRQLHNGANHFYTGVTRAMHFNHVHWGYDEGGFLPPGISTVVNATGRPEPVLTSRQWDDMAAAARGDTRGGGDTINIEFAENKLTIGQLEAYQQRRDALHRVNRRNR